jgi:integrase
MKWVLVAALFAAVAGIGCGVTRTRKFFYGRTRAEAAAKLTKGMRDLQLGLAPVNERTTLEEFLTTWLKDTILPNKRPATYRGYSTNVRLHIVPSIGHLPLAKLTPAHVRRMMNAMIDAKKSPRTVQYARAVLRSALKQAQSDGAVHRNVAELTAGPTVEKAEIHPLSPEQVKTFLEGVVGDPHAALYAVAFTMGLRQSDEDWSDKRGLDHLRVPPNEKRRTLSGRRSETLANAS